MSQLLHSTFGLEASMRFHAVRGAACLQVARGGGGPGAGGTQEEPPGALAVLAGEWVWPGLRVVCLRVQSSGRTSLCAWDGVRVMR